MAKLGSKQLRVIFQIKKMTQGTTGGGLFFFIFATDAKFYYDHKNDFV